MARNVQSRIIGNNVYNCFHSILDVQEGDLCQWLRIAGEKPFHASQILHWIYTRGITEWECMTDLRQELRAKLAIACPRPLLLEWVRTERAQDDETMKYLWRLLDGQYVESVLILAPGRRTVCVSCQVGCPARCAFCASGKEGLKRNLQAAEIVEQVYAIDRDLKQRGSRVSHVVFMGMGEPMENYEHVVKAIRLLSHPRGCNISQRRITVSTVGVTPEIHRFAQEGLKANLALSLHAPNSHIRKKIIPYERKFPLAEVMEAMRAFSCKTKRDITYEYTLLMGINDQPEHAHELARLVQQDPCTVNLIPYNPVGHVRFGRPTRETIEEFRAILVAYGIQVTWRYTKGRDIAAACGQLALHRMTDG